MPLPSSPDTLVCDTTLLRQWRGKPQFDYEGSLQEAGPTLMDELRWWLSRKFNEWFRWSVTEDEVNWIFVGIGILLLLIALYIIYKKNPKLFGRSGKNHSASVKEEEDTIYGVDFEKRISKALQAEDYYQAVRCLYLLTLKEMNDAQLIAWLPYKTPSEYIYELADASKKEAMRRLTNQFMRVRYGNYTATRELFHEMEALSRTLTERRDEA